jgi:hypothetical protein
MKPRTRDNLIYLAVGVSIAAITVGMDFYAESHGKALVRVPTFTFRAVTSMLLMAYFVAREARRRVNATLNEVVMGVLVGGLLSLAVSLAFRQTTGQLSGILYAGLAALEVFLIVELTTRVVSYSRRVSGRPAQTRRF